MKTSRLSFALALAALVALTVTNADARRYRRRVAKVGPNVVRQTSLNSLRQRINLDLGADRIVAHVQHLGRRKASLAFAKAGGKPQRLDVQRLLPQLAAPLQQRVTNELAKLGRKPAATWLNGLQKTITNTQNAELRTALTTCAGEIKRLGSAGRPADWMAKEQARFEKRFARKLLRRQSGSTAWLLPKRGLPALPASKNPQVAAELKKLPARASNAMKVARLERVAATLLGSAKPKDQRRGKAVRSYLASYKSGSWVDAFFDQRLNKYAKATGIPWKLGDSVSWHNGVSAADKRLIEQRLKKAWTIARGAVHPELLARTPAVTVEVDANASGASHQGDKIHLRPDSSVKDILHELGHHIEDYGGLRTIAGAHGILNRRAFGSAMKPITEIDPTGKFGSYAPGTLAYAGAFQRPYMGKVYQNGSTEIMSVALEKLADRKAAKQFFKQDGDHFLQMLNAMQRKPWPMVN